MRSEPLWLHLQRRAEICFFSSTALQFHSCDLPSGGREVVVSLPRQGQLPVDEVDVAQTTNRKMLLR